MRAAIAPERMRCATTVRLTPEVLRATEASLLQGRLGMSSTNPRHVAVWLDHHEARVLHITQSSFDESTLHSNARHVRRHPDRNVPKAEHTDDWKRFFRDIVGAIDTADEVLVLGPSTAKMHFLRYAHENDPALAARIVGVETVDHPTDPQLAAFARQYFHGVDRMLGLVR
jgi:stalled ribosome rescue protein Dom34